jgi:hypothetical protein
MSAQLRLPLGKLRQPFIAVDLQRFSFSFLHGEFFFFVAVRAMPRVAAALAARFVVSYFFSLTSFVIYMISCGSAHFISFVCKKLG